MGNRDIFIQLNSLRPTVFHLQCHTFKIFEQHCASLGNWLHICKLSGYFHICAPLLQALIYPAHELQHFKILDKVKRQMIRDHFHMFGHTNDIPRHLHVNLPDGAKIYIPASGSTTVAQLLRAEAINLAHGEMMHICDGPRALPADQILLEQGAYGPYSDSGSRSRRSLCRICHRF